MSLLEKRLIDISKNKAHMKIATGTLQLFDTSGVDHDGTNWKPQGEYCHAPRMYICMLSFCVYATIIGMHHCFVARCIFGTTEHSLMFGHVYLRVHVRAHLRTDHRRVCDLCTTHVLLLHVAQHYSLF